MSREKQTEASHSQSDTRNSPRDDSPKVDPSRPLRLTVASQHWVHDSYIDAVINAEQL